MKIKSVFYFYMLMSFTLCYSQQDTFKYEVRTKQEEIISNELKLKNAEIIKLTKTAFEITNQSKTKDLVNSYSIKLYKQNEINMVIVKLNSQYQDLIDSTFMGGYYNSQGKPVFCFGKETLCLSEDIDKLNTISFISRKHETETKDWIPFNSIDGTSIMEASTKINGEEFRIVIEYFPSFN